MADAPETTHDLKVSPMFWSELASGDKNFELRYDDRGFRAGDVLLLREWSRAAGYSGNELRRRVTHIVRGRPWLADGYVCMGVQNAMMTTYTERVLTWWSTRNRERRIDRNFLLAAFALIVMMAAVGCWAVALDAIEAAGIWAPL